MNSYYEVCLLLQNGYTRVWDAGEYVPYAYRGKQWISFDDIQSVGIKVMKLFFA